MKCRVLLLFYDGLVGFVGMVGGVVVVEGFGDCDVG